MPVVPSMEIMSPSRMTTSVPATAASFFSASIFSASTPHTHGAPMPRAMTAAWRRLAAMGGEDALGGDHAGQVVGVGLPAHEHALAAGLGGGHGVGGGEDGLAHRGARARVQAAGHHVVGGVLVELRVQQLVELVGGDAA